MRRKILLGALLTTGLAMIGGCRDDYGEVYDEEAIDEPGIGGAGEGEGLREGEREEEREQPGMRDVEPGAEEAD